MKENFFEENQSNKSIGNCAAPSKLVGSSSPTNLTRRTNSSFLPFPLFHFSEFIFFFFDSPWKPKPQETAEWGGVLFDGLGRIKYFSFELIYEEEEKVNALLLALRLRNYPNTNQQYPRNDEFITQFFLDLLYPGNSNLSQNPFRQLVLRGIKREAIL